jgi:hypothetical protein
MNAREMNRKPKNSFTKVLNAVILLRESMNNDEKLKQKDAFPSQRFALLPRLPVEKEGEGHTFDKQEGMVIEWGEKMTKQVGRSI